MEPLTLLGCRVDAMGRAEAVERIVQLARASEPAVVVTLGTEMVVRAQRDASFRDVVNASALSLCDTVGVLLAARLHGTRVPERVAGADLIDPLCAALAREHIPLYLIGGARDTAERAGAVLALHHPGLRIVGARDGYFGAEEDERVANAVAASGARVLFVGMGSPRQELWVAKNLRRTGCSVGIGVGGSLDVIAGNVKRAPALWRKLNVEWLYRLVTEPRRFRRQLALPHFVLLALRERLLRGPRKGNA